MTNLIDGPAHGKRLMLHRAVRFIRVVIDPNGEIDALDQPEDTPKLTETIHVYECFEMKGACHIRASKGRGGFYPIIDYKFVCTPPDAEVRNNFLWREWCEIYAASHPPIEKK